MALRAISPPLWVILASGSTLSVARTKAHGPSRAGCPVPFEKSCDRVESSETVVILSLAVPWMPRTSSAGQGLARERESRGIPLVESRAPSTRTGPSDTYARSSQRETLERDERELWALSYRPSCSPNERISPHPTIAL